MQGIDWSQYSTWSRVTAPNGQVYYAIPGNDGYLYDPFMSSVQGRPVVWQNPTYQVQERERLEREERKARSPINQLIPVAGSVGGLAVANNASDIFNAGKEALGFGAAEAAPAVAEGASLGTAAAQGATSASSAGATALPSLASGGEPFAVGSAQGGGTLMSDGSVLGSPGAGIGTFAQGALGAAGLGAGTYGMAQAFESGDELGGAVSGLGAGLGASSLGGALGLSTIPGLGWMAAGGALLGLGLGALGDLMDKDRWKTETNRLNKLRDDGVFVPDEILASMPTRGRSKDELIEIEQAKVDAGQYGNVEFARTRDEKFLKPQDIVGYAAFAEKDPTWFERPLEERFQIAQEALDAGAVREGRGTINVDWKKVDEFRRRQKEQSEEGATP